MSESLLLIECEDRPGLVHGVSGVLFQTGLNVTSNHEFVDPTMRRFFMRTGFSGAFQKEVLLEAVRKILPSSALIRIPEPGPKKLVVLVSHEHHCLADLLIRQAYGQLAAQILAVISNHDLLRGLTEKFEIPFHYCPTDGLSREQHEDKISILLQQFQPEYVVLAKYMRILSPAFVGRWSQGLINIHHSFLPAFAGAKPYHQAYERGVKVIGATAHFVTEQLDEGPIIEQQVIPVDHSHTPQTLAQAGRDVEQMTLARALRLVFDHRVFLCGPRTIIFE